MPTSDSDPLFATTSTPARASEGEHCYTVAISGVEIENVLQDPYEYMTCVFDPDAES